MCTIRLSTVCTYFSSHQISAPIGMVIQVNQFQQVSNVGQQMLLQLAIPALGAM